ncbi:DUF7269 family protein [Halopelagius longus]|uniref:Uncharacterized protein n=1 Tax=Halopelagius longus TaxID=1236180 RepID=A0A1H1DHM7_9EURY|nr:hypothetical protein [Halopelagius longus]RDI71330.1 hypothetical protein DWB78_06060 [Halopelagius longus]SDQ75749.1 hypothetical protein SAMN05216278_2410 [Halopelagius longus]
MNLSDLTAAAGGVFVLGGLAGLAGFAVPGLNATTVFVTFVGLIAGVQGLRYALRRRNVTVFATETGDTERRYRVPVPGEDADRELSVAGGWRGGRGSSGVRERIRESAVETLVLRDNCTEAEAEARIDEGSWTDDPVAARYLGADAAVPLRTRIRLAVRGDVAAVRATRAVAAVERLRDGSDRRESEASRRARDGREAR